MSDGELVDARIQEVRAAVAVERERCAKIVETYLPARPRYVETVGDLRDAIAEAIRQGNHETE